MSNILSSEKVVITTGDFVKLRNRRDLASDKIVKEFLDSLQTSMARRLKLTSQNNPKKSLTGL